ncbi:hypothetical protein EVJ58_g315 [Rhodofomes roseus]|uniref:Uncharacterized protein n=1 Tax=Rhodofomes roseus TaxID=34475 RepID=A0A4Y9Z734_9APHY|nr:hypothetical protein EVJ58_g315 [Rhodofomes roseus]
MVYPRPGVPLPRLRLLKLDHRESLLSELYRLVTCAPNLKTLVLANTVPMQDVILQSASDADGSLPRVLALLDNGDTHDVPMAGCLEHLDWSFAPPAYTWLLFVLLPMPNLRSLALCLNTESTLWPQYMSDDPLFLDIAQNGIPVRLSSLQELVVQCIDDGALKHVFRKIRCPVLAKLHITYLPPLHASCELPQLPRLESMFCDPRLYTLTDLKLSHFTLDPDEARIMLRYMPALTHLTFLECPQVAAVICALSGGSCDNGHENPFNVWICPRLEVLRVVDSPDLKFQCLRGMIHARSQAFGAPAPCMSSASPNTGHTLPGAPSPRVVKPLRRKFRDAAIRRACNVTLSPSAGRATAAVYNPYAAVRPSQLRTVCIEGCGRVSQIEATSLRGEFPSLRVKWQP